MSVIKQIYELFYFAVELYSSYTVVLIKYKRMNL